MNGVEGMKMNKKREKIGGRDVAELDGSEDICGRI